MPRSISNYVRIHVRLGSQIDAKLNGHGETLWQSWGTTTISMSFLWQTLPSLATKPTSHILDTQTSRGAPPVLGVTLNLHYTNSCKGNPVDTYTHTSHTSMFCSSFMWCFVMPVKLGSRIFWIIDHVGCWCKIWHVCSITICFKHVIPH